MILYDLGSGTVIYIYIYIMEVCRLAPACTWSPLQNEISDSIPGAWEVLGSSSVDRLDTLVVYFISVSTNAKTEK